MKQGVAPRYCFCARDNAEGRHPLPAAYTILKEGEAPQSRDLCDV